MPQQLFTNNAVTTLAAGIASGATSLTVATGKGALFPSPANGDYALLTLIRVSDSAIEIVSLTSRTGDVLTVTRAQESTTALAFVTGDSVELRITAGWLNDTGYINVPQNSQSTNYTAVMGDAGCCIFHPSTDANARTFTIPANASVPYQVGTALAFVNMTSQVVSIAITTDVMYLAGVGTVGTRSLAQYGTAVALKIDATHWLISGTGLT